MDLGLSQPQLAKRLGVTMETILNWELNKTQPGASLMPQVSTFLGGFRRHTSSDVPSRLRGTRDSLGVSQVGLAVLLGIDPSTVLRWEHGMGRPPADLDRILDALSDGKTGAPKGIG